jgi:signal transduction histidine kinase
MGRSLRLRCELCDLVALVQQAAADQQRMTERHRLRVESALPTLVGTWDAARLRRVLDNLLANAVKYSPAGGEVTVSLETADRVPTGPQEDPMGGQGRAWAVLQVRDQGVGIPAADQAHIFERFWRGGNVGHIAGRGLGLAGVRHIVQQHGGSIDLQSQEGAGSTFTIRLPLDPTARDEAEAGIPARASARAGQPGVGRARGVPAGAGA